MVLFWAALFLLYPSIGLPITILGILPVLMGAWVYGMWPGMFLTLGLYCVDTIIIVAVGWDTLEIAFLPNALLGLATSAIASLILGRLGENERRNQEEFRQHKLLLEERTASARFLNLLNDILLAAIETDDKSSMLRVLAIRTGELFKTDNCCITFWDEKERLTIVLSEHRIERLLEAMGRLVVLDQGRIVHDGKPSDVFQNDIAGIGVFVPPLVRFTQRFHLPYARSSSELDTRGSWKANSVDGPGGHGDTAVSFRDVSYRYPSAGADAISGPWLTTGPVATVAVDGPVTQVFQAGLMMPEALWARLLPKKANGSLRWILTVRSLTTSTDLTKGV